MQLGNPGIILFSFWIRFLWARLSLFFTQHCSFKWKYSLKTVGNTTKEKKKSWPNLNISHLIRKKNILVKCNWTECWITGEESNKAPILTGIHSKLPTTCSKCSVLYHTPCWGSQLLTLNHLWSYKRTVCGTSCSEQCGWKLVPLKATAAFHVWPR